MVLAGRSGPEACGQGRPLPLDSVANGNSFSQESTRSVVTSQLSGGSPDTPFYRRMIDAQVGDPPAATTFRHEGRRFDRARVTTPCERAQHIVGAGSPTTVRCGA